MRNLLFALLLLLGSVPLATPAWAQDDELLPRHRPRLTDPEEGDSDDGGYGSKGKRRHARPIEDEGEGDSDEPLPRSRPRLTDDSEEAPARRSSPADDADADEALPRSRPRVTDDSDEAPAHRSSAADDADADEALPRSRPRVTDDSDEAPAHRSRDTAEEGERPRARSSEVDDEGRGSRRSYDEPGRSRRSSEDGEDAPRRRRGAEDDEDWNSRPGSRTAEDELRAEESGDEKRMSHLDEPGIGLAAELHLGAIFLDDSIDGFRSDFAWGLGITWQLGRMLFAAENAVLHKGIALEAVYLHPLASDEGTEQVRVEAGYHHMWLAALVGYPFRQLHVYGKVGPAMYVMPVDYDVQGQLTSWTSTKGGLVYGLGARTTFYLDNKLGIAARVELSRFRRGYLDDTLVSGGIGLAF